VTLTLKIATLVKPTAAKDKLTGEPTNEPTDEPTDKLTDEPTDEPTTTATLKVATPDPTDEAMTIVTPTQQTLTILHQTLSLLRANQCKPSPSPDAGHRPRSLLRTTAMRRLKTAMALLSCPSFPSSTVSVPIGAIF
jgi:hypothetical protein